MVSGFISQDLVASSCQVLSKCMTSAWWRECDLLQLCNQSWVVHDYMKLIMTGVQAEQDCVISLQSSRTLWSRVVVSIAPTERIEVGWHICSLIPNSPIEEESVMKDWIKMARAMPASCRLNKPSYDWKAWLLYLLAPAVVGWLIKYFR